MTHKHSPRPRHTTQHPTPEATTAGHVEGCPRVAARSGYASSTGCHPAPSAQDHPWSGSGKAPRPSAGRRTSRHRHGTALGPPQSICRDGRSDRGSGFGMTSVEAARRGRRSRSTGVSRPFSVSRWFRERWQMGPDDDRQWQNTRSALPDVCAGQRWFCLVSGGAPGRIRTCDTRFRNGHCGVSGGYALTWKSVVGT